ncbi:outer membrane-specific lipoprotein transporter subunit; ATP-binding component of ABC superfamily [uncultured Alphaproteobacteria bacterium]|uniref:Outer membrane-specific lipoprotein transporter subunit ATP-binding component of ABC superfamily n=1 Tax=uncultured Alphaproteobacteria bacterium TaxID=91750 RepID=A0A212J8I7_9PROT|nr:outer membrane-specific lipoprotein transporter subunit; ATP-binding component of ABC superfamily [uncultured Alphaproteobacteria bacterium]
MSEVLVLDGVVRRFVQGGATLNVLADANLRVRAGEIVALVGPSGSGKSTLLQLAGLLERPDEGEVSIDGRACGGLGDAERTRLRREALGFVYQQHHLLPEFSAIENVIVPQMIAGVSRVAAKARAAELLGRLGLGERLDHRPGQLSGGEQQRVAICRALANAPRLLLADEPTGNLDPETSEAVFAELLGLVRDEGLAALIATHNPELAGRMDRRVTVRGGAIVEL